MKTENSKSHPNAKRITFAKIFEILNLCIDRVANCYLGVVLAPDDALCACKVNELIRLMKQLVTSRELNHMSTIILPGTCNKFGEDPKHAEKRFAIVQRFCASIERIKWIMRNYPDAIRTLARVRDLKLLGDYENDTLNECMAAIDILCTEDGTHDEMKGLFEEYYEKTKKSEYVVVFKYKQTDMPGGPRPRTIPAWQRITA